MSVTGKAIWYIESHLRSELSLAIVADAIGVSTFHLCRAFPVSAGISFTSYLRGRRLSEAAEVLAQGAPDILAVALDLCYGSHEAFTRAFRQQFGLTPEQVRSGRSTNHLSLLEPITMQQTKAANIAALHPPRTAKREALLIFGLGRHYSCQDSNAGIPSQWDAFLPHFGNIPGQVGKIAYGVICNSDNTGNYDYICGVEVTEFPSHPAGYSRMRIPAQTYAVFDHKDHISTVNATWAAIWNHGLSRAGYQAVDGPAFERYGEEFDGRTGLGGLELWVPVKT